MPTAASTIALPFAICLGFSRAEQRVLLAIEQATENGRCVATLEALARAANVSRSTARNAINRAVAIGLMQKTERRSDFRPSLPNVLLMGAAQ